MCGNNFFKMQHCLIENTKTKYYRNFWKEGCSLLNSKQRSILRGLGNELEPILIIGKGGVTPHIIEQLDQVLTTRELIKGRVLPHTDLDPRKVAEELASETGAEIVQVIGRNILFYRQPQPGIIAKISLTGED
jgi:RNA-binding protein